MVRSGVRFDMMAWQTVPWPVLLDDVRCLEELGIGTLWVGDHYAWPPFPSDPVLEAWTTLAALAARTTRIRLGTLISNVATRHPAMLAKQAATVDCISGGRLELGVGPGFWEREHDWLGIPFLTPAARIDRFSEAVKVIDTLLRNQPLSFQGEYYHLDDAPLVPAPVQRPRPPLLIAANGKRALRVVAEHADVWVSQGREGAPLEETLKTLRQRNHLIDEYCSAINREQETVERAYFALWGNEFPFASRAAFQDFVGRYREAGIQRFIFFFASAGQNDAGVAAGACAGREVLEAFAAEIIGSTR